MPIQLGSIHKSNFIYSGLTGHFLYDINSPSYLEESMFGHKNKEV